MKRLFRYEDFLLEAVIKKTMPLYYSPKFKSLLKRLSTKNKIADFLLTAEDSNQISDIYTLIDITDKNDMISFVQVNRILRSEPESDYMNHKSVIHGMQLSDKGDVEVYRLRGNVRHIPDHEFWHKGRTQMGIGRWARRVIVELHKSSIPDSDIEQFVNQYKATFDGDDVNFEIVKGEDIRKYYLESNYETSRGQLGNSCMRYMRCQPYLDIYVKNPEVCSLLILRSDKEPEKIKGRALLWKLETGEGFQDRIYTINDSDRELFEDWGIKNGYKKNYDNTHSIMYVQLGKYSYSQFPYMDTFLAYSPTEYKLSNDESLWPERGYWHIQHTDGSYRSDDVVWSEWHDDYISRENAVYCSNIDGYVNRDSANYLSYKDEWAVPNDDICYSEYFDEWYYNEDTVYSEMMSDVLYNKSKDVIKVLIEDDEYDYCVKLRSDLYIEEDGEYYSREKSIRDPFTKKLKFANSDYIKELDDKLMSEFGIEKNSDTLSTNGVPKRSVIEEVREDLKVRLIKLKFSDDIKNMIVNNQIYKSQVRGVYWGLHKEDIPNEEDMFNLLKCYLLNPVKSRRILTSTLNDIYGKFKFFAGIDGEKRLKNFNHSGVFRQMMKVLETCDLSQLPEDIYKRFLFTTI